MPGAPGFWWRRPGLASALLWPFGAAVGVVALHRMARAGGRAGAPVLCVGNPTVGGAGKTPTAIALLDLLAARGARPFALLRGHGGSASEPLVVDPEHHGADLVGDEALLLARHAPTIVAGSRRLEGAALAVAAGATHIVMDDGFQNPSLHKDAAVLVVDGAVGAGNGCVTPAGPLRAPLGPQLARADAVLVMGPGVAGDAVARQAAAAGCAILHGSLAPDPAAVAALRGQRLVAFAGIGRPEKFFATLEAEGLTVASRHPFADHHPYRPEELARLAAEAQARGALLATTQKDFARLSAADRAALGPRIAVLPVTLRMAEADALAALVARAEERFRARAG